MAAASTVGDISISSWVTFFYYKGVAIREKSGFGGGREKDFEKIADSIKQGSLVGGKDFFSRLAKLLSYFSLRIWRRAHAVLYHYQEF